MAEKERRKNEGELWKLKRDVALYKDEINIKVTRVIIIQIGG